MRTRTDQHTGSPASYPIYLSSWSIRDQLSSGQLTLDRLAHLAREHQFQGVEFVDRHFDNTTAEYFKSLTHSVNQASMGATIALTTDFTINDDDYLQRQIQYVSLMLNYAQQLGAKCVRILLGGVDSILQKMVKKVYRPSEKRDVLEAIKKQKSFTVKLQRSVFFPLLHRLIIKQKQPRPFPDGQTKERIFKTLDIILPRAEKLSLPLAIENHWGITAYTENLVEVIDHYQSEFLGTCPDFGNFTTRQDRYEELRKIIPMAKEIHAKSFEFDDGGEETTIDYQRCINMLKSSSFSGPVVVEFEGKGDNLQNSLWTRDLILKYS